MRADGDTLHWVVHVGPSGVLDELGRGEERPMAVADNAHSALIVPVEEPFGPLLLCAAIRLLECHAGHLPHQLHPILQSLLLHEPHLLGDTFGIGAVHWTCPVATARGHVEGSGFRAQEQRMLALVISSLVMGCRDRRSHIRLC